MANDQLSHDADVVADDGGPKADLVLEGGGVKAIAHVGAIAELESRGYSFNRVAGTSGGAIAAAFVAACMHNRAHGKAPATVTEIEDWLWPGKSPDSINYSKVTQGKASGPLEHIRELVSLITEYGEFDTGYLHEWIREALQKLGVETFADLRLQDPDRPDWPAEKQYRLVVMATDISRGSLVRLPWDYHLYGLNPDDQLVADAVVASASVPGFFHPMPLIWSDRSTSLLVDGSTCSGFPIEVFDRPDDRPPRWPTFGLKLEAEPVSNEPAYVVKTAVQFVRALVNAAVNGNDEVHLADPGVLERTIFVDTSPIPALEFELSPAQQDDLFRWGQTAAGTFCDSWDWPGYLETNSVKDRLNRGRRAAAARGERSPASKKRTVVLSE